MNATIKSTFLKEYQALHEPFVRYCASRSYGLLETEDLVQESILIALENFEKIKNADRLLAYLIGIANNLTKRYSRRQKFSGHWQEEQVAKLESKLGDAELSLDIHYLHQAIQQLPAAQREAVLLFHISGLSIKELADLQQSSESAVKTRLSRARATLKKILVDEDHHVPLSKRLAIYASVLL